MQATAIRAVLSSFLTMNSSVPCQFTMRGAIEAAGACLLYLPPDRYRQLRRKQSRYVDLWADVLSAARPEVPTKEVYLLVRASIATAPSAVRYEGSLSRKRVSELLQAAACGAMGI